MVELPFCSEHYFVPRPCTGAMSVFGCSFGPVPIALSSNALGVYDGDMRREGKGED